MFVPLLVMSVAANTGYLPLSNGFAWLVTTGAMNMLAMAAVAEVLAFYIPAVDNLLDTIATPAAIVAGIAVLPHPRGKFSLVSKHGAVMLLLIGANRFAKLR